jgi:NadR type nicotinamide-nucleotide adenylyltransferase
VLLKKIVVIGPESTGKSTLCEQLAQHYKTQWCAEYAREYLLKHGMDYNFDDLLTIARGQIEVEDKHTESMVNGGWSVDHKAPVSPSLLFIDTDMYVMKVWCEFVFGRCHQWILDQIALRKYDLYLLCNTDLPWVPDELREYPDFESRERLFRIYKDIMINQDTQWTEIKGNYDERLRKAIETINTSATS